MHELVGGQHTGMAMSRFGAVPALFAATKGTCTEVPTSTHLQAPN